MQKTYFNFRGKPIPVKIYHERRRNVRASIGKRSLILRLPTLLDRRQQKEQYAWFANWVEEQFQQNEALLRRFYGRSYEDGSTLQVGSRTYRIRIEYTGHKTHHATIANGVIQLRLSEEDHPSHLQKSIKHLLSRVVGQDFKPSVTRRVIELNRLYFQQPIKSVNLKYNQSNWGSCSSMANINLSTRLLFAPEAVIDYVIIHELAHLIEMNHSPRFWKLVSEAMPDYKEKEQWLKKHGELCQF